MYLLVDLIAIIFVLGLTIYGLIAGFTKSTVNVILVIVCVAGAGVLAYLSAQFIFVKIGWVAKGQGVLAKLFGDSKISGGQTIIDLVCYWISFAFFTLISFVLCYIVLNILRKLLSKLIYKLNNLAFFGVLDKVLGTIVNLAFSAGLVLVIMALFYALGASGKFAYGDEVIRASEILKLIHPINPLNNLFLNIFNPVVVI